MKILSLSDMILTRIYSPGISRLYPDIDLVLGCGDLPYYYLEYVISALNVPLFYVRGNHSEDIEVFDGAPHPHPFGGIDLHRRVVGYEGLILAGVEGSLRYRLGQFQYTQAEMWGNVLSLVPALIHNRVLYGRYLDIFVTHASPWGIHDQPDLPHQGIKAFRWLLKVFKPAYHFHGHIHVYRPDEAIVTRFQDTLVINTFGQKVTEINILPRS